MDTPTQHDQPDQYDLAEGLHRAVGWGLEVHLIENDPVLRALAGLGEEQRKTDGYRIRDIVKQGIGRVENAWQPIRGQAVPAPKYQWGARTLLAFQHSARRAPGRRRLVLDELGLGYTLDRWARVVEVEFFLHLAAVLV